MSVAPEARWRWWAETPGVRNTPCMYGDMMRLRLFTIVKMSTAGEKPGDFRHPSVSLEDLANSSINRVSTTTWPTWPVNRPGFSGHLDSRLRGNDGAEIAGMTNAGGTPALPLPLCHVAGLRPRTFGPLRAGRPRSQDSTPGILRWGGKVVAYGTDEASARESCPLHRRRPAPLSRCSGHLTPLDSTGVAANRTTFPPRRSGHLTPPP